MNKEMNKETDYIVNVSVKNTDKTIKFFNILPFCKIDEYMKKEDRLDEFYNYLIYRFELDTDFDVSLFEFTFNDIKNNIPKSYMNFNTKNNIFDFYDMNNN